MSSKLDQMRDQFRQRLALRSVTTSKCDLNRDHNQNIVTTDCSESEAKSTFTPSLTRNASEFPLSNKLSYSSNFKHQSLEPKNRNPVQLSGGSAVKPTVHKSQTKRQNKCLPSVKSRSERIGTSVIKREPKLVNQVIGVSVIGGFGGDGTPCRHCGRSFALTERLVKHESVCDLSNNKSRKTFDSMQQRFKGLPKEYFESYENTRNTGCESRAKSANNWRQKHEYCITAIRSAKGESSRGPTTGQIMASMQQQCDYCKRRFSEDAIKRHLPICAKLHHKKVMNF